MTNPETLTRRQVRAVVVTSSIAAFALGATVGTLLAHLIGLA